MVFHGKKTVPTSLRRDHWRPYFSIHFPQNPAGAHKGLLVFRELRELSLKRQLDPPRDVKYAREGDVENFKARWAPLKLEKITEIKNDKRNSKYHRWDIPVPGNKVTQKLLAKRLMNQRRTAVADVAAVLQRWAVRIQDGEVVPAITPQQRLAISQARHESREALLSTRAAGRLKKIRAEELAKEEQLEAREDYLTPRPGYVTVDRHALSRISTEYDGNVGFKPGNATELDMIVNKDSALHEQTGPLLAYEQALAEVQAEKNTRSDEIEARLSAQIESELSHLTEAERTQIQKEVELQRAEAQKQIDTQLTAAREKLKNDKEKIRQVIKKTGRRNKNVLAELRRLQRDRPKEILQLKIDLNNKLLKWAGPFADINTRVEEAMAEINDKHASRLEQLREAANQQKKDMIRDLSSHKVEIRWANIADGTYAQEWPESVVHNQLQPKAVVKYNASTVRQHLHFDQDENLIEEQRASTAIPRSNSVHVFGSEVPDTDDSSSSSRYVSPETAAEQYATARQHRVDEWTNTSTILLRDRIVDLQRECAALESQFDDFPLDSDNLQTLSYIFVAISHAQESLESIIQKGFDADELANIELQLDYARQNLPNARIEVMDMANTSPTDFFPEAEEARIRWIEKKTALIEIEANNPDAAAQADLRRQFLAKFDQREAIERRIREHEPGTSHENREICDAAIADLGRFDREAPFIVDIFRRREDLAAEIMVLNQRIEEESEHLAALPYAKIEDNSSQVAETENVSDKESTKQDRKSTKEKIAALRQDLARLLDEQEMNLDDERNDKKAWLEFKDRGGLTGYLGGVLDRDLKEKERGKRGSAQDESAEQQTQGQIDDGPVVLPQRSVWGRIKEMFGRR